MKTDINLSLYLAKFFLEWEVFLDKSYGAKSKHNFIFNNSFFGKPCPLRDNVDKHCRAGQATNDNKAHAHYMLDS